MPCDWSASRCLGLALALSFGAPVTRLVAQSCNAPCSLTVNAASLTPTDVLRLSLSSSSVSFTAPVEADYTAAFKAANGPTVTAKANRAFHVTVDASSSTFGYSGALTNPGKPASDLQWATASGGPFSNNVGTAATLFSGSSGTAGTAQAIFFRTNLSYAVDRPGSYTLTVRYTLSAP
jgi:hypothetical protein